MKQQILILLLLVSTILAGPVRDGRIVGGYDAVDGQFPYMVSLREFWNHNHVCGGCIINERWVLSATHCLTRHTAATLRVVVGSATLRGGLNAFTHGVSRIVNHPPYPGGGPDAYTIDISIIRVTHPFIWSRFIQPIRLGSEFVGPGVQTIAMGWGDTTQDASGVLPNTLQWISQTTLSNADCQATTEVQVHPHHMCSFSRDGQGVCFGDSGGPLVVGDAVVGVSSFLTQWGGCGRGTPDGWDRVSSFHGWILENAVG